MTKETLAIYVDLQELPTISSADQAGQKRYSTPVNARNVMFAIMVIVPAVLGALYYGFIASDVYVSESKFVIRSSQRQTPLGLPSGSEGLSVGGMDVDVAIVNAFIESPDVVAALVEKANLRDMYGSPKIDPLSRFPGPLRKDSKETLHDYYRSMIDLSYDRTTQITTLAVKAYRAEDTLAISKVILGESELLVNKLSERMKSDMIRKSEKDLKEAEAALVTIQEKLAEWRKRYNIVDPAGYAKVVGEIIANLSLQLATLESRFDQMRQGAPNNPAIRQTELAVEAVKKQIAEEWDKLSGKSTSMSAALGEYEQLNVEYLVAQKVFAIAKASAAEANSKVQNRETYLVAVSEPQLPTIATYPYRTLNSLLLAAVCWLFFVIFYRVWSNIFRHGAVVRYTSFKRNG